ncbi:MAG: hypothetical protein ABS99_05065 [Acetobacteraceae bacterium SCN 69-10]|nr:response regulator [Rhodospirillales bacterium]ODU57299.1 MAG: hypothetical protein ABS99_05065 [Acetobacteraceae bacterium SCN 69-10]OJY67425.1 MAG: hypothetical protein BGP12_14965 [Rhodospirillales bacterium 70-18]
MVHVVDDDAAVRRTLALVLTAHNLPVRCYDSAEQLLSSLDGIEPGCMVVDLRMPGMNGMALQRELVRRGCRLPVIIVTGHAEVAVAVQAMKAGAVDFLEKPYSEATMLAAIRAALAQLADAGQHEAQAAAAAQRVATLTPREREVLHWLLDGCGNKMIAQTLGISPRTVEIHRARLMEKLECRSLAEVLRTALAAGVEGG